MEKYMNSKFRKIMKNGQGLLEKIKVIFLKDIPKINNKPITHHTEGTTALNEDKTKCDEPKRGWNFKYSNATSFIFSKLLYFV